MLSVQSTFVHALLYLYQNLLVIVILQHTVTAVLGTKRTYNLPKANIECPTSYTIESRNTNISFHVHVPAYLLISTTTIESLQWERSIAGAVGIDILLGHFSGTTGLALLLDRDMDCKVLYDAV